jgi:cytochrome c-type biogenesis protein CcmF
MAIVLPFVAGQWKPLVSLGLLLATWIVATILLNVWERVRVTSGQLTTFQKLRNQSRSYYGMQLAHLGVAVFIIGVTLVTGYQSEQDVRMEPGSTVNAGGYEFRFVGATNVFGPNYRAARAEIIVSRNGAEIERMYPEKRRYTATENVMTETAIDNGVFRHLYVSMGEQINASAWSVRIYYKPFVGWIWYGAVLMALGGGVALSDRRYALARKKALEKKPIGGAEPAPAVSSVSSVV